MANFVSHAKPRPPTAKHGITKETVLETNVDMSPRIELAGEQELGRDRILKWVEGGDASNWCFHLKGYAGTGKTTLMKYLGEALKEMGKHVYYCTPTGKAASVLYKKLDQKHLVTTIHRLLYIPRQATKKMLEKLQAELADNPTDKALSDRVSQLKWVLKNHNGLQFVSKGVKADRNTVIIVDEASMVHTRQRDDLQKVGALVLFVGDGAQLPPVKSQSWFIDVPADHLLETIHRQALESQIIRMSMDIRTGNFDPDNYKDPRGDARVCNVPDLVTQDYIEANQVLTGMNRTRQKLNVNFRKALGYASHLPMRGDKLICLKNEQDEADENHYWINGVQARCLSDAEVLGVNYVMDLRYDEGVMAAVRFYEWHCLQNYGEGGPELEFAQRKGMREFDYAYAITVHKSQGSEWPHVMIFDDRMREHVEDDRRRWLYTAITRASEKLVWVLT